MSEPERAKSPPKSKTDEYSLMTKDAPIRRAATAFVLKLLFIFKIDPFFKSYIIQKRYDCRVEIKINFSKREKYETREL